MPISARRFGQRARLCPAQRQQPAGRRKAAGAEDQEATTPQPPDEAADYARQQLEALIRKFEDESEPYTSLNLSMWSNRYGRYDDLARIKEWSAAGGLGIEEW